MFLKIIAVRKRYDGENILNKVSFTLGYGEKVGIIGKNGAGKTTLLRLIAGLDTPTSGKILIDPPNLSIGYHTQVLTNTKKTIQEYILDSIPAIASIKSSLEKDFSNELLEAYEQAGGYRIESNILPTLQYLGLGKYNEDTPVHILSGGERTRLQLAPIIIEKPDILLLDEPTNHLDIPALEFLERYIAAYKGIVIIASHDETFLSITTSRIIEIHQGAILDIKGGYETFLREKAYQEEKVLTEYNRNKLELDKLKHNLHEYQQANLQSEQAGEKQKRDNDKMAFNFLTQKAAKKYARRADVTSRKIKTYDSISKPVEEWNMKLALHASPIAKKVFRLKKIEKSYSKSKKNLFTGITLDIYSDEKIALIGKNGSGKSTLLKILFGSIKPTSGTIERNASLSIGYLTQDHLEITATHTIIEDFLDAFPVNENTARNYLHKFLFKEDQVYRKIETFSQGEKAKYAFAKMLYRNPEYLLLDEPTNYMDMTSKAVIEKALSLFQGGFLIATHDRALITHIGINKKINIEAMQDDVILTP